MQPNSELARPTVAAVLSPAPVLLWFGRSENALPFFRVDMSLPTLRPAKPALVPTAPCVLFELDGDGRALDRQALEAYVFSLCGATTGAPLADWLAFAKSNQLVINSAPLSNPKTWATGAGRWFTVEYPTDCEAHICFGRVGGVASRFTHLDLMRESVRWVPRLRRKATRIREVIYLRFVPCFGGVLVGGLDTGMTLSSRQSFVKTLFSRDTALALFAVAGPVLVKSFTSTPEPSPAALLWTSLLLGIWMLGYSIFRHLLLVPGCSWGIDGLGER